MVGMGVYVCVFVCELYFVDEGAPSCPVLELPLAYRFLLIALLHLLSGLSGQKG